MKIEPGRSRVGPGERTPETNGGGYHVDRSIHLSHPIRHVDQGAWRIGGGKRCHATARWSSLGRDWTLSCSEFAIYDSKESGI